MRRFPTSWDSTLAALGLKRKVTKPKHDPYWRRRRSRLEQLERREMLSAEHLVTTHLDVEDASDGVLSLREAVAAAGDGDTIRFAENVHDQTITLGSQIQFDDDVTIEGPGADSLTVSGGEQTRVFWVKGVADVTFRDFTIADGAVSGSEFGAGINSFGGLTLERMVLRNNVGTRFGGALLAGGNNRTVTITDTTFIDNEAKVGAGVYLYADKADRHGYISGSTFVGNHATGQGGGVYVRGNTDDGDVQVVNSTFWHNSAVNYGGGVRAAYHDGMELVNVTVFENSAGLYAGGLYVQDGQSIVQNSIVAHNTASSDPDIRYADGEHAQSASNHTTADGDPMLAPLGDYGGHTTTLLPLEGSPVIDTGDANLADQAGLDGDQRGGEGVLSARQIGEAPDLGAAEAGALPIIIDGLPEPFAVHPLDTAAGQTYVATNNAGQSAIVWVGDGDEGDGLYVQLLAPDGDVATQPRRVDIGQPATADYLPQVAIDGDGNYAVVWTDDQNAYLRRYRANGTPVDTLPLAVGETDTTRSATLVTNESGQLLVAWAGATQGVQFRRFTTRGLTLDAEARSASSIGEPIQWATTGRGAALTDAGDFYLTWADAAGELVYLQKFSSAGQAMGDAVVVADANDGTFETPTGYFGLAEEGGAARPFDIAVDPEGRAVVSWRQEFVWTYEGDATGPVDGETALHLIAYRRYDDDASLLPPVVIDEGDFDYATGTNPSFWGKQIDHDAGKPGLAVDQHGRVGVAWSWGDYESHYNDPNHDPPTSIEEEYQTRLQWFTAEDQPFSDTPHAVVGIDHNSDLSDRQFHSLATDAAGRFVLTSAAEGPSSTVEITAQRFELPQAVKLVETDTDTVLTVDALLFQQPDIILGSRLVGGERVVTLNGAPTRFRTADITALRVTGGAEDTFIDLTRVTQDAFSLNWVTVDGGHGDDVILGSEFGETITGGTGSDRILGGAGDDVIHGGDGEDVILAGAGNDILHGEGGDDTLQGEAGADTINGGAGADRLDGGSGDTDVLDGGLGDDTYLLTELSASDVDIHDTGDEDTLDLSGATEWAEVALSGDSNGVFGGNAVNLSVTGDLEVLIGTAEDDTLTGNNADNRIVGGAGIDVLTGGAGVNRLEGGAGDDTYVVVDVAQDLSSTLDIHDASGGDDRIDVGGWTGPRAWVTVGEATDDQTFGALTFIGAGLAAIEDVDGLPDPGNNTAPELDAIGPQTVTAGQDLILALSATDDDAGDTLEFHLGENAPAGVSILGDDGAGNALLVWPSGSRPAGQFTVTVRVTDDGYDPLSAHRRFVITNGSPEPNAAPTLSVDASDTIAVDPSDPSPIPLVIADDDEPNDELTVTLGPGAPHNAEAVWDPDAGVSGDWTLVWAPTAEQTGAYTFDVRVTDNGATQPDRWATPLATSKTVTVSAIDSADPAIESFGLRYYDGANPDVANATLVGEVSAPVGLDQVEIALEYGYPSSGDVEVDQTALIDVADDDPTRGAFHITPPHWVLEEDSQITIAAQLRWWDSDIGQNGQYVFGDLHEVEFTPILSVNVLPSIAAGDFTLQNDTGTNAPTGAGKSTDPRLKGVVTHADGPVDGLWVYLYSLDSTEGSTFEESEFVARVKTDQQGRFSYTPNNQPAGVAYKWWAVPREELYDGSIAEASATQLGGADGPYDLEYVEDEPPEVNTFVLVADTGESGDDATSDPRMSGTVVDGEGGHGNVEGVVVQFDHDGDDFASIEGFAITDKNGAFTYLPTGLSVGMEVEIDARAVEWSEFAEEIQVSSGVKTATVTYNPAEVDGLTLGPLALKSAPGAGSSEDRNTIVGTVETPAGAVPVGVIVEFSLAEGDGDDTNGDEFANAILGNAPIDGQGRYEFTVDGLAEGTPVPVYVRARYLGAAAGTTSAPQSINVTPEELPGPALLDWGLAYDTGAGSDDNITAAPIIRGAVDYAGDMADLLVEYRNSTTGEVLSVTPDDEGAFEFALEELETAPAEFDPDEDPHTHAVELRVRVAGAPAPRPEFDDELITTDEDGALLTNWYLGDEYNNGEWTGDGAAWFDEVFADDGLTFTGEWHGSDFDRQWQSPDNGTWEEFQFTYKDDEAWAPTVSRDQDSLDKPFIEGTLSGAGGVGSDPAGLTLQFYVDGELDGETGVGEGGHFRYTPARQSDGAPVSIKLVDPDPNQEPPRLHDVTVDGQASTSLSVSENATLQVTSLELKSPSGGSEGAWEAIDPTLVGAVSGPEDLALLTVEFDYNGDGLPDARTLTDGLGEFEFTPEGLTGEVTVQARLVSTVEDAATGDEHPSFGPWRETSWTVVTNVEPQIAALHLALDTGPVGVLDRVTSDPTLVGRVTDANHFAYVNVEFDHDGDNVVDGWTSTDADGHFRYTPQGLTEGGWDIRARVTEYDPTSESLLNGDLEDPETWAHVTATGIPGDESSFYGFTLEEPEAAKVDSLNLLDSESTNVLGEYVDPTLEGTVSDVDTVANVVVKFYSGPTNENEIGSARVQPDGSFTFAPEGLDFGAHMIRAVAYEPNYLDGGELEGTVTKSASFTFGHADDTGFSATPATQDLVDPFTLAITGTAAVPTNSSSGIEVETVSLQRVDIALLDSAGDVLDIETVAATPVIEIVTTTPVVDVDSVGEYEFTYEHDLRNADVAAVKVRAVGYDDGYVFSGWTLGENIEAVAPALGLSLTLPDGPSVVPHFEGSVQFNAGQTYQFHEADVAPRYDVEIDFDDDDTVDEVISLEEGESQFDHELEGFEPGLIDFRARPVVNGRYADSEGVERSFRIEGAWEQVSIDFPDPAPQVGSLALPDPVDPTITGQVTSPLTVPLGTPVAGMTVQIDENGDGLVDGTTLALSDGSFSYTLTGASPGEVSLQVRAVDAVSDAEELVGGWTPFSFTLLPPQSPVITELELETSFAGAGGQTTTEDPVIVGMVEFPEGAVTRTVQFDHEGDGQIDGSTSVDAFGAFTYRPEGLPHGTIDDFVARGVAQVGDLTLRGMWTDDDPESPGALDFVHLSVDPPVVSQLAVADAERGIIEGRATSGGFGERLKVTFGVPSNNGDEEADRSIWTNAAGYFRYELPQLYEGQFDVTVTAEARDPNGPNLVTGEPRVITLDYAPAPLGDLPSPPTLSLKWNTGDDSDQKTANPTMTATFDDWSPQMYVDFDFDATHDVDEDHPSVPVRPDGTIEFLPEGLTEGEHNVYARARHWDPVLGAFEASDWTASPLTFTLDASERGAPLVESLVLHNDPEPTGTPQATEAVFSGTVAVDGDPGGLTVLFDHNGDGQADGATVTKADGAFYYRAEGIEPSDAQAQLEQTITATVQQTDLWGQTWNSPAKPLTFILTRTPLLDDLAYDAQGYAVTGDVYSDLDPAYLLIEYQLFGSGDDLPPAPDELAFFQPSAPAFEYVSASGFTIDTSAVSGGPAAIVMRGVDISGVQNPYNTADYAANAVPGPWRVLNFSVGAAVPDIYGYGLVENTGDPGDDISSNQTVTGTVGQNGEGAYAVVEIEVLDDSDSQLAVYRTTADATGAFTFAPPNLQSGGAYTIKARSVAFDPATQSEFFGDPQSQALTLVDWQKATISSFSRVLNPAPDDPKVEGTVVNPDGSNVGLRVEFDIAIGGATPDGVADASVLTDGQGKFSYTPLGVPQNQDVTIHARVLDWDPAEREYAGDWVTSLATFQLSQPGPTGPEMGDDVDLAALDEAEAAYKDAIFSLIGEGGLLEEMGAGSAGAVDLDGMGSMRVFHRGGADAAPADEEDFERVFDLNSEWLAQDVDYQPPSVASDDVPSDLNATFDLTDSTVFQYIDFDDPNDTFTAGIHYTIEFDSYLSDGAQVDDGVVTNGIELSGSYTFHLQVYGGQVSDDHTSPSSSDYSVEETVSFTYRRAAPVKDPDTEAQIGTNVTWGSYHYDYNEGGPGSSFGDSGVQQDFSISENTFQASRIDLDYGDTEVTGDETVDTDVTFSGYSSYTSETDTDGQITVTSDGAQTAGGTVDVTAHGTYDSDLASTVNYSRELSGDAYEEGSDTLIEHEHYSATLRAFTEYSANDYSITEYDLSETSATTTVQQGAGSEQAEIDGAVQDQRTWSYGTDSTVTSTRVEHGLAVTEGGPGGAVDKLDATLHSTSDVSVDGEGASLLAFDESHSGGEQTDSGTVTTTYSFSSASLLSQQATVDAVGDQFTLTASENLDYGSTYSDATEIVGESSDVTGDTETHADYRTEAATSAASSGRVDTRITRTPTGAKVSAEFDTTVDATTAVASQTLGTHTDADDFTAPFRTNEVVRNTIAVTNEGVFTEDTRAESAGDPEAAPKTVGRVERDVETVARSTDYQGLAGKLEGMPAVGEEGVQDLVIDTDVSYALEKTTSRSRTLEEYDYEDAAGEVTREGTFREFSQHTVDTSDRIVALTPGASWPTTGYPYFISEEDARVASTRYVDGALLRAADEGQSPQSVAASQEWLDTRSSSSTLFADSGERGGEQITLKRESGSSASSSTNTRGLILSDADSADEEYAASSRANFITDARSYSSSQVRTSSGDSESGEYARARSNSRTSNETSATGTTSLSDDSGVESSTTDVMTVTLGLVKSSSDFTSRTETDDPAQQEHSTTLVRGGSENKATVLSTSDGTVTAGAGETASEFEVTSNTDARARVESEVDATEMKDGASLERSIARIDTSSARVDSHGSVTTDVNGDVESDFSFTATVDTDTDFDSNYTITKPTILGPRVNTGSGDMEMSRSTTSQGTVTSRNGDSETEVDSSSETGGGDYEFDDEETFASYVEGNESGEGTLLKTGRQETLEGGFDKPEKSAIDESRLLAIRDGDVVAKEKDDKGYTTSFAFELFGLTVEVVGETTDIDRTVKTEQPDGSTSKEVYKEEGSAWRVETSRGDEPGDKRTLDIRSSRTITDETTESDVEFTDDDKGLHTLNAYTFTDGQIDWSSPKRWDTVTHYRRVRESSSYHGEETVDGGGSYTADSLRFVAEGRENHRDASGSGFGIEASETAYQRDEEWSRRVVDEEGGHSRSSDGEPEYEVGYTVTTASGVSQDVADSLSATYPDGDGKLPTGVDDILWGLGAAVWIGSEDQYTTAETNSSQSWRVGDVVVVSSPRGASEDPTTERADFWVYSGEGAINLEFNTELSGLEDYPDAITMQGRWGTRKKTSLEGEKTQTQYVDVHGQQEGALDNPRLSYKHYSYDEDGMVLVEHVNGATEADSVAQWDPDEFPQTVRPPAPQADGDRGPYEPSGFWEGVGLDLSGRRDGGTGDAARDMERTLDRLEHEGQQLRAGFRPQRIDEEGIRRVEEGSRFLADITPGVSQVVSGVELYTGENFVSGDKTSGSDDAWNMVNIVTAGVPQLGPLGKLGKNTDNAMEHAARSSRSSRGVARQVGKVDNVVDDVSVGHHGRNASAHPKPIRADVKGPRGVCFVAGTPVLQHADDRRLTETRVIQAEVDLSDNSSSLLLAASVATAIAGMRLPQRQSRKQPPGDTPRAKQSNSDSENDRMTRGESSPKEEEISFATDAKVTPSVSPANSPTRQGLHLLRTAWLACWLSVAGFLAFSGLGSSQPSLTTIETVPVASVATYPTIAIEKIRVGDRVAGSYSKGELAGETKVDPATWRKLRLRTENRWKDGTLDVINVTTLQPPTWVAEHRAKVGATAPLPLGLLEMGLPEGLKATVVSNEPCPPIEDGPGRVVLNTVDHLNDDVYELAFASPTGKSEAIHTTGLHKFYRPADDAWVSAHDLSAGDQLEGPEGPLVVLSLAKVPGVHRVYNLTVETEHVYRVATLGALVHNNGCAQLPTDKHHVFPQEFRHEFEDGLNIPIDDYTWPCRTISTDAA